MAQLAANFQPVEQVVRSFADISLFISLKSVLNYIYLYLLALRNYFFKLFNEKFLMPRKKSNFFHRDIEAAEAIEAVIGVCKKTFTLGLS